MKWFSLNIFHFKINRIRQGKTTTYAISENCLTLLKVRSHLAKQQISTFCNRTALPVWFLHFVIYMGSFYMHFRSKTWSSLWQDECPVPLSCERGSTTPTTICSNDKYLAAHSLTGMPSQRKPARTKLPLNVIKQIIGIYFNFKTVMYLFSQLPTDHLFFRSIPGLHNELVKSLAWSTWFDTWLRICLLGFIYLFVKNVW